MSLAKNAVGVDGAFSRIPIIDLSKCGTPEGRLTTAHEIRDACMRSGFFCVKNHGIPQLCLDNVLDAVKTYFDLPMETKMKIHHETVDNLRGYSAPLDSTMDPANKDHGLFYEAFIIGWEGIEGIEHDRRTKEDGVKMGPNVWPSDDCPGFREACLNYYHAGAKVGEMLFKLFALALELPESFLNDKTQNTTPMMRIMHYPSQDSDGHLEIDNTPGVGAHTELTHISQCFTILWQQPGIESLQVMNSEKQWVDIPAIEDTLVINVGDELEMWTNDVFKSTVHRAVNRSGKERYSFPMFFGVDYHVKIEPIPSCVSADRPAKHDSITAGEYVNKRIRDTYPTT
ncbi:hypothetical protein JVU11DRAFT_11479 [Chiua virens]|nr:hypothetical protein JVU11DRAFT_11479 [Chiua virens]